MRGWIALAAGLVLFAGAPFGETLASDAADLGVPLQDEVDNLEALASKKTVTDSQLRRLSEIYFLTSRCEDVKRLGRHRAWNAKTGSEVACVCYAQCSGRSKKMAFEMKLAQFKKTFTSEQAWTSKRIKALWATLSTAPEAQYWALKQLRYTKLAKQKTFAAELEKSLEALEVQQ
jgi:hypothetical protein